LIILGFTASFAAVDWQMCAEPFWYSTIYGFLFLVGQTLQAWAFALIALVTATRGRERPPDAVARDLGNLLLAFVVLWTYLSFMQYLIIWSGNLPDEVVWVLARTRGGWQFPVLLVAIFQFALPFSALLFRATKHYLPALACVAGAVVGARILEQYWLLMPAFSPSVFRVHASDPAAWLLIGAYWTWLFRRQRASRPHRPPATVSLPELAHA
jgi:hypothetical protein